MATVPKGSAAYKKKDGILTVTGDQKSVTWTPLPGTGPPVVSLAVSNITNLQQTPDNAPKVMLKVFGKVGASSEPATYLFHFNAVEDARGEANAVRDHLSRLLANSRTQDPSVPKPAAAAGNAADKDPSGGDAGEGSGGGGGGGGTGLSAAMSFASTANTRRAAAADWFDDDQLKSDVALQQSLMRKDGLLQQVYMDARETRPEAVSDASFNAQFWSTRVDLLRRHAIDTHQKKGSYNVLSAVKPRTVDGELKLNISVEQVQLIFQQHPLVKRIYDEGVPTKLNETEFWSRFFLSRLSKRLRGERVAESDASDALFDKYNPEEDTAAFSNKLMAQQHIPHMIDLEGNEENQGGLKSGNRKDVEMRARARIPIMQTLNSLSEKIMATVAPSDHYDPSADDAVALFNEQLVLRDLQDQAEEHRMVLNAREQRGFFSHQEDDEEEAAGADSSRANGAKDARSARDVLLEVRAGLRLLQDDGAGGIDLHKSIGIDDNSDGDSDGHASGGDDEAATQPTAYAATRAARREAQAQVLDGLARKRAEVYGHDADDTAPMGLPPDLAKRCYLANATTAEFLKQFWGAFLSGDAARAQELACHAESLRRSVQRIEAVAAEADEARAQTLRQKRQDILDYFNRTGRKIKWKPESVRGGKEAVLALLAPTMAGLRYALELYTRALQAEGISSVG